MNNRGFTLLEIMVATMIMAVAVTALLSNLSVSLRTASRITDSDRATLVARAKMDELLADSRLPHNFEVQGALDPTRTGWPQAGWRAIVHPFDIPPGAGAGSPILEQVRLQVWWVTPSGRRTFDLDAYRRGTLLAGEEGLAPK